MELTHKELIELAIARATGIGNWKIRQAFILAKDDCTESYQHSVYVGPDGTVKIEVTLESPAIA